MAFIFEISTSSTQQYIPNYIISIIREFDIPVRVTLKEQKIVCAFTSEHEKLQECLEAIAQKLPASFFLKSTQSYTTEEKIEGITEIDNRYPLNLGLCPSCQKEMFDVSSRRYYYPFSSCSCCGGNHSFLTAYPYTRENTSFKFITSCASCESEVQNVGLKEKHKTNSCHECGIPVRLVNKTTERYANDAGSFRTMFEVAAKALVDEKRILIKTTFGYRLFFHTQFMEADSILMLINAKKITDNLSLIPEEFNALLSIERPILHVTLKNEALKMQLNANTHYVKYPDEGFTILLASELQKLGVEYIAYKDVDETCDADMLMDYDLEVQAQKDMRLFLNKEDTFLAEGERVAFPSLLNKKSKTLSIAENLVGISQASGILFDDMEYFESVHSDRVNVLNSVHENYHPKQQVIAEDEASFMSVIAEHSLFNRRCVGAYFDEVPSFLYYDTKNVLRIVPPKNFEVKNVLTEIETLREGSDRLVSNFQKMMPEAYERLKELQEKENVTLFEATAVVLGLKDESMRGLVSEAMKFVGKGGIQIDTHVKDNRFDNAAFLASIISYQLADVSTTILSYSIFESLGDYFNDILQELKGKTKAEEIILCGAHFANQSLFSRMQRNLRMTPPRMNINYPISKESCVVGGAFL